MTEEVQQHINAPVHGHVAAGNITVNHIHVTRRSYQELLHEELAGACHEDLERIRVLISDKDLYVAVTHLALQTNGSGQLVRKNKWLDYGWAGAMLIFVLLALALAVFIDFHLPRAGATLQQTMAVWALITGATLFGFWVLSNYVWPQRTAGRAMRILGE